MAFKKGQSGNPAGMKKGTKHVKTRQAERRALHAAAAASSLLALPAYTVGKRPNGTKVGKIDIERAGINAKALLNTAMRIAWERYHELTSRAGVLEDRLVAARAALAALVPDAAAGDDKAQLEDLKARQAAGQEACQKISTEINDLRATARASLADATGWAKDVAPYEFPRLMTQNGAIDANLTITIKKYSPKAKGV